MKKLPRIIALTLGVAGLGLSAAASAGGDYDDRRAMDEPMAHEQEAQHVDMVIVDLDRSRVNEERDVEIVYDQRAASPSVKSEGIYAIFDAIDTDDSEFITFTEATALEGLPEIFYELDEDEDQKLGMNEFDALVAEAY